MPPATIAGCSEAALIGAGLVVLAAGAFAGRRGKWTLRAEPAFPAWPGSGADVLFFLLAAILGVLVAGIGIQAALPAAAVRVPTGQFLVGAVGFDGGLLGGIAIFNFAFLRLKPDGPRPAHSPLLTGALWFLAALPPTMLVMFGWSSLLQRFGIPIEDQAVADMFLNLPNLGWKLAFGLFACVLAPVAEEFVFRAGIFRYLRGRMARGPAVALSALIFAAVHLVPDVHEGAAAFLPLACFAAALALAYEDTGRIGTPIVAHALFNLNTLLYLSSGLGALKSG